jgi:hypothetical protein
MALQLGSDFKGISANYWKIIDYHVDDLLGKTYVTMGLYVSSATRSASKFNLLKKLDPIPMAGIDLTRAQIYDNLKKLDIFKSAKDC